MAQTVTELAKPRETKLHQRGDFLSPGDVVSPGTLAILPTYPIFDDRAMNRLDLARWLVAAENPLTAQVTVNRIWQQHFGRGLVATTDDFGRQGRSRRTQSCSIGSQAIFAREVGV